MYIVMEMKNMWIPVYRNGPGIKATEVWFQFVRRGDMFTFNVIHKEKLRYKLLLLKLYGKERTLLCLMSLTHPSMLGSKGVHGWSNVLFNSCKHIPFPNAWLAVNETYFSVHVTVNMCSPNLPFMLITSTATTTCILCTILHLHLKWKNPE